MNDLDIVQETTYNNTSGTDVTLIADKPTMVRAYASSRMPTNNVTAVLHGSPGPNSPEFPDSPLKALNGPGAITATRTLTDSNFIDDREDISQTFNFLLPPEWIHAGDLTLKAELQLPAGVAFNPAKTIFTETVKFVTGSQSLWIGYIPYCYQSMDNCASDRVSTFDAVIRKLYPINPKNVHYFRLFTGKQRWLQEITKIGPILFGRGRDGHRWPPPAQIRTCRITAYGSCLRFVTRRSVARDTDAGPGTAERTYG